MFGIAAAIIVILLAVSLNVVGGLITFLIYKEAIIIAIILAVSLVVGGLITFLVYNKIRKGLR